MATNYRQMEELFIQYRTRLLHTAGRYLMNQSDCEDAVQETFLRLLKKRNLQLETDSPKTEGLLFLVLKNICLNELEKHKRTVITDFSDDIIAEEIPAKKISQDWQKAWETEDAIHRAVRRLQPEVQDMLWLSLSYGFSPREIGKLFNKKEDSVRKTLYRAKKELQEILKGSGYET